MEYKLEQLMSDRRYGELCNILIGMAKDDVMRSELQQILYYGEVDGFSLKSSFGCKDNPRIEATRRISMAYLLIDSPATFDYLVNNNINVFHGTNSNALPSILKHGLCSVDEQKSEGITNCTGEEWSRVNGGRGYVSFTDVFDTAIDYSSIKPNDDDSSSFGVIIGTCVDDVRKLIVVPVSSNFSEIGAIGVLEPDSIKVICVPKDKENYVRRLVGRRNIKVMSFKGIDSRFYYSDDSYYLEYYPDDIEDYKNNLSKRGKFSMEEVAEVVLGRSADKIIEIADRIGKFFRSDKNDEHIK